MKAREIVKAVLFIAGIVMLTHACKKDEGPTLDFNITVPSDWKYYILSSGSQVYYAQSPLKNSSDTVTEDIVITKNKAQGMSLSSFYDAYYTAMTKDDTTIHAVSSVDTAINGENAVKLTHLQTISAVNTMTGDTVHLYAKIQKYFMINNNFGYVVSCNSLTDTFSEYKKIFDEIMATFTFKK